MREELKKFRNGCSEGEVSTLFSLRAHFRVDFRDAVDDGLRALHEWPRR